MQRARTVAIVRVAHVIAELDDLVGRLFGARYTAGGVRPHERTATSRERRQAACTRHNRTSSADIARKIIYGIGLF